MTIWKQHLVRNDIIIIMVNQAVWLIKLIELLFLFHSKSVWPTKQLGLPGYVVTRNCGKIRTSKKQSKLCCYQLKVVRRFLSQKESGSEWECIDFAGSHAVPSVAHEVQILLHPPTTPIWEDYTIMRSFFSLNNKLPGTKVYAFSLQGICTCMGLTAHNINENK